ncbi:NfeD family protein [Alkalibacillus haloalkaliphilus]|uniref:NfeD family protein n=1 Tax=Alkalibacillus haloalkaliphilus TaxID=94136 RepID=UPI0029354FCC|nr:nodulation protein NfeD [Alkalibacillus haloalkaliphilus]MDV2581028.1 nodulation protein NfeD [Alkalibacillus haloalkaliphilus]
MKRIVYLVVIFALSFIWLNQQPIDAENDPSAPLVYIVPVEEEVERGLAAFMDRSIQEAEENFADHIIFEVDTPGGRVDSANEIAGLLSAVNVPTTAYVKSQALSAGSYISLMADDIYMNTNGTMGASGVVTGDGSAADSKAQSAWVSAMVAAAERNDRDPIYARAMADDTIDLSEYNAGPGEFLTLSPNQAYEVGYAEGVVNSRDEVLEHLGYENAHVVETQPTLSENIARFVTSPIVIPILLSIASIGLIVELYSPGFGIPGIMGVSSLILFFYGHLIAGFAGHEAMILLLTGLVLIILEIFFPSGVFGIIGGGAILGAMLVSGADMGHMALSIGISLLLAFVLAFFLFKKLDTNRGLFKYLVLKDQTSNELGYVSNENRRELVGMEGQALTFLRPSGTALFGDERLDVVSEGGFIDRNHPVKVVKVEGSRIVVRELINKEEEN